MWIRIYLCCHNSGWWSVPDEYSWNLCNWRCSSIPIKGMFFFPLQSSNIHFCSSTPNSDLKFGTQSTDVWPYGTRWARGSCSPISSALRQGFTDRTNSHVSWTRSIYKLTCTYSRCISNMFHLHSALDKSLLLQLWLSSLLLLKGVRIRRKQQENMVAIFRGQR